MTPTRKQFSLEPRSVKSKFLSVIKSGSKLGIDTTKKLPGEGFKRPWPPLTKMDAAMNAMAPALRRAGTTHPEDQTPP